MLRGSLYTKDYFSSSSDDDQSSSSDTDEPKLRSRRSSNATKSHDTSTTIDICTDKPKNENILFKLLNRERTGHFANVPMVKIRQKAFETVPSRLHFCLKDIVPFCYLQGHVFMGLTICGQFLLSYKAVWDEEISGINYNFSYKYELFFWIFRPHNLLSKYYMTCLFDDHGLDRMKTVTMAQWQSNPRTLIVHGASEDESEDSSYYTIVSVPKLGCLDCRKLRDDYYLGDTTRCDSLCIKCNLTIHTKYTTSESDPKFDPPVNLRCPERIIMFTNGLIHMLNVRLDHNKPLKTCSNSIDISYINNCDRNCVGTDADDKNDTDTTKPDDMVAIQTIRLPEIPQSLDAGGQRPVPQNGCEATTSRNIVAQIIEDFAECETSEYSNQEKPPRFDKPKYVPNKYLEELQISCIGGSSSSAGGSIAAAPSTSTNHTLSSRVRLLSHRSSRTIMRNASRLTTAETAPSSTLPTSPVVTNSAKTADKAAKAYEFSEDTDKYEKISSFRKRRLADKKYEFSEDNAENIIPFTKLRMSYNSVGLRTQLTSVVGKSSALSPSPFGPTSSTGTEHLQQQQQLQTHTHRASPSHGFRSPCGSPVGNRFMSPPGGRPAYGKSPTYAKPYSSPRQFAKRADYTDTLTNALLSPRSDDFEMFKCQQLPYVQPLSEVKPSNIDTSTVVTATTIPAIDKMDKDDKPMCSKKLVRRYVEEDDATSVITSEEDDCISPGYHTSLPVEVHGSCYSDMQMISKSSYQQLKCPSVVITQHTFDLETLTYHIANFLCTQNNKKYGFAYDWACEPINICPLSSILSCVLVVNFTACDMQPFTANCTSGHSVDCVFHCKHFECRSLFTWNIENGDWQIIDYGELVTVSQAKARNSGELSTLVKQLATELSSVDPKRSDIFDNLLVLGVCEKSKGMLRDTENSIEFYRDRRSSGSVSSSRSSDDLSEFF